MLKLSRRLSGIDRAVASRAGRGNRSRRNRHYSLESLENRIVLSYTFSYNVSTQVAAATDSGTSKDSLVIEPVSGFLEHSVNDGAFSGDWGGMTVPASSSVAVDITLSTGDGSSLSLGTPSGPASELLASFSVVAPANTADSVTIDDSAGTTVATGARSYSINTSAGSLTGPGFSFSEPEHHALEGGITLKGSAVNGDVYNVLSVAAGEPFTIVTNSSTTSTVNVAATVAGSKLTIDGQGTGVNDVNLGAGVRGGVNLDQEGAGLTNLTLDLTNDSLSHDFYLSANASASKMTDGSGNYGTIAYTTSSLASLTIETDPTLTETLNVDFGGQITGDGFNPIPYADSVPGLIFKADGDGTGGAATGDHILNLVGTPDSGQFTGDTWNAQDPANAGPGRYGNIALNDGRNTNSSVTNIVYSGLTPITDTTPAASYTFNDFGYPDQSFSATDGPMVSGFQTLEFASTPTPPFPANFETTDIANKNFVTFNTPPETPGTAGPGVIGTVNVPIASNGLLSLTFNTPLDGENAVSLINTPPGVVASLNGGSDVDVSNVTGLGVAAGTVLFLNGGPGTNSLNYDAGGKVPTITPGLQPGEVLISIPGAGTVDAINYAQIKVTGVSPLVITPGPGVSINSVAGFQLVNTIVASFTAPIAVLPPPGGLAANDFTASIDWGDPSVDPSAGSIIQDASNPSVYYITGTHTFAENGTYTVANTVAFAGGSYTAAVNNVPISITVGPAGPIAGTDAIATVTQGTLAVSAFPIIGTEGIAIPTGPIATFIDAGGADLIADYSATITVTDSSGATVVSVPAASITQNGNAAQFTVNAPAFTLPEEGTYQVVVAVTDDGGTTPITVDGASFAVIADAPLTAGAPIAPTGSTGILLSGLRIGSFTDANPGALTVDFTGVIDWGDGSPTSVAQFGNVGPGAFNVYGSHTYAKPGAYDVTTNVGDDGGKTTSLNATFTISDLPVTGATKSFTATEGINTGLFALATFTDPNTLATVADVNAQLAIGGWGDGTPTTAGVTLVVQEIGVTSLTSATDPGDPIFEVVGSHTYAEETFPGLPDTLSVIITTLGGATTTLTSPPGGGVTVLDAPLTSSNGTEITGIEGNSTGTVLLGTFTDANPISTPADFTATIAWGGTGTGSTAGSITQPGGVGTPYLVSGSFTYAEAGTYAYSVTVTDDGGQRTNISGSSFIAGTDPTPAPTAPPIITALNFDRFDATLTVTFEDDVSGMDITSITNSAFYHISATPLSSKVHVPKTILPTSISYTPGALPSDPVVVNVVFNNGHTFRGGKYEVIINSGTGGMGIHDAAGTALDGNFYGSFPTGDGIAGGNFVADIYTYRNVILPFVPIADGYVPPKAAIDPPAGSSQTAKTHKVATITHKTKVAVENPMNQSITVRNAKITAFDAALRELVVESKAVQKTRT
jgi:hypothetical protein